MSDQGASILVPDSVELFRCMDAAEADKMMAAGTHLEFDAGRFVYKQGAETRCFYIVLSGEVELTVNIAGGRQAVVGHIGPGGHFGETSLLTGSPNSVNVWTLTPVLLCSYSAGQFFSLLLSRSTIHKQLSIALARRLRVSFGDHASTRQHEVSPATAAKILDQSYVHNSGNQSKLELFKENAPFVTLSRR